MGNSPDDRAVEHISFKDKPAQIEAERDYYRHIAAQTGKNSLTYIHELSRIIKNLKQTEDALRRSQAELETRVTERTADLIRLNVELRNEISERKQIEEMLRVSRLRYQALLENTSDWVWEVDENARYTYVSRHVHDLLGYNPEEVIGKTPFDLMPEDEKKRVAGIFYDFVSQRRSFTTLENKNQHKDGHHIFLETSGVPFFDESGNFRGYRGIDRDITERKRLEQEMLKSQKLESLGTLAGGIAHDFNNLLQGIFGYISMAKIFLDQREKSLAMLEQAENALHQSVSLTTQLLTFSKGGKPVKKRISLLPVIENAAKFALSGSQSSCQLDIEPGLWQVDADGGQLGQVIQNIVLNADHAMSEGGIVLITAKNVLKPDSKHPQLPKGNYIEISVQDSGIGIPEKYLTKIFDPYFTTKEKGSGLGLATSYSIIRNHGGLIDVISESGKGTMFRIYLPAIEVEKEFKETPAVSPVVRKGRILVMDDEELVRSIAGELIKTLGHEVDLAEYGEAAIEKYEAAMKSDKPFDIVILDLTVRGGMGGRDTVERLHVIDPGVRAIVSSGYSDDAVVADYEKYGFKARLTKPYKLEELRDTLDALLSA